MKKKYKKKYCRIDGDTDMITRDAHIDEFTKKNS